MGRQFHVGEGENFINSIRSYIQAHLVLEGVSDHAVSVVYAGDDRRVGGVLVTYFSRQLQRMVGGPVPKLQPDPRVEERRVLWRSGELGPAMWITLASLVMFLVLVVILEWADPSLKTVRQASRHLQLPVLGVMPDLEKLETVLHPGNATPSA
jgi:hypothetical protein